MPRTTLKIDPDLLRRLKELAARQGMTLQRLVNDLLRQGLGRKSAATGYRLELKGWKATEQPGVDILDRDKLFDLLDGR